MKKNKILIIILAVSLIITIINVYIFRYNFLKNNKHNSSICYENKCWIVDQNKNITEIELHEDSDGFIYVSVNGE